MDNIEASAAPSALILVATLFPAFYGTARVKLFLSCQQIILCTNSVVIFSVWQLAFEPGSFQSTGLPSIRAGPVAGHPILYSPVATWCELFGWLPHLTGGSQGTRPG